MTRTLVALVRDQPGVLNRAVSLIRRRGHNIDRLVVGRTELPGLSRLTVAVDEDNIGRVIEQLRRLIDVVDVSEVSRVDDSTDDWSQADGGGWGTCTMPTSYHYQADGADDHVND